MLREDNGAGYEYDHNTSSTDVIWSKFYISYRYETNVFSKNKIFQ